MTRMQQLQEAVRRYGQSSIDNNRLVRSCGEALIYHFRSYLGSEPDAVLGVPPRGSWDPESVDYGDEKFSFFGAAMLQITPVEMGLSVRIPNLHDEGELWVRVVVTIEVSDGQFVVAVGDGPSVRIALDPSTADLDRVSERIFEWLLAIFENPVRYASAVASARIGFILGHPG